MALMAALERQLILNHSNKRSYDDNVVFVQWEVVLLRRSRIFRFTEKQDLYKFCWRTCHAVALAKGEAILLPPCGIKRACER